MNRVLIETEYGSDGQSQTEKPRQTVRQTDRRIARQKDKQRPTETEQIKKVKKDTESGGERIRHGKTERHSSRQRQRATEKKEASWSQSEARLISNKRKYLVLHRK